MLQREGCGNTELNQQEAPVIQSITNQGAMVESLNLTMHLPHVAWPDIIKTPAGQQPADVRSSRTVRRMKRDVSCGRAEDVRRRRED